MLRFWFDRGVAGIRIDSAALLVKDPTLPDVAAQHAPGEHPYVDRDELHDIYRGWRAVADSYADDRASCRRGLAAGARPGSRGTCGRTSCTRAFNFDFLACPWDAGALRDVDRADATAVHADRSARRPPGCCRTTT